MKVLILTEGGKKIGFGHITRCISLYEAFREKGVIAGFLVNTDSTTDFLMKGIRYKKFNWLNNKKKTYDLAGSKDAVIIDSYFAGIDFYKTISGITRTPVYIDDFARLEYPRGIVLNGAVYAKGLPYPKDNRVKRLLGTRYLPIRKAFWDVPEKKINKKVGHILLSFGGHLFPELRSAIKARFRKDYKFYEISPGSQGRTAAAGMRKIMLKADICISGGGQTTYELARCGIPAIGICFAENQLFNLEGWQKKGSLYFAGWRGDKDLSGHIEEALGSFSYNKRLEMSAAGRRHMDGLGARRAVSEALSKKHV